MAKQLNVLLALQLVYAAAGALFNLVSLWVSHSGAPRLTDTNPILGIIMMTLVAASALIGQRGYLKLFRLTNLVLLVPLLLGGFIKHIVALTHTAEISLPSLLAVSLNFVGIMVMAFGLLSANALLNFQKHSPQ